MIAVEQAAKDIILCRASGFLTKEDYETALPELERAIERSEGRPRVLILLEDFRGWQLDALWQELRFDLKHRKDFERIAVVGDSRLQDWGTRLSRPFFAAEMRYFSRAELPEAEAWLSAR